MAWLKGKLSFNSLRTWTSVGLLLSFFLIGTAINVGRVSPISGMEEGVAMVRSTLTEAIHAGVDIKNQYLNAGSFDKVLREFKLAIAVLMFGFAVHESVRMAKSAWRAFRRSRQGDHDSTTSWHNSPIIRKMRLAMMLILCLGPIGFYGRELPLPGYEAAA